jgi:short-subunit dehydrogenase
MGERVVISGASSGIGAALAEALAMNGVEMLLLGRQAESLKIVSGRCHALGAGAQWRTVDLRDRTAVGTVVSEFALGGGIQLLIANAGVLELEGWPQECGPDWMMLERQITDNLACTLSLLEAGLSLPLQQRRQLHCVVISSMNAFMPVAEAPGYCVAKVAQKALVEVLEDFYAHRTSPSTRVRFTTVYPGFVKTGMAEDYPGRRPFQYSARKAASQIATGIRAGRREIIFPRRLALLLWLKQWVPAFVVRRITSRSRAFKDSFP